MGNSLASQTVVIPHPEHRVEMAAKAELAELCFKAVEVALHQRLHISVGARRARSFTILDDFAGNLGRQRQRQRRIAERRTISAAPRSW